jgi:hypothetical protein
MIPILAIAFWVASLIGWYSFALGDIGEYPTRFLWVTVSVTLLALVTTIVGIREDRISARW